ncbi:MAG: hypothetical protein ACKOSS_07830 [Planctomycetia bacterium]
MRPPTPAVVLVAGLLAALGAAWMLAQRLAPARPVPAAANASAATSGTSAGKASPAAVPAAGAREAGAAKPRKGGAYEVMEVAQGGTIRVTCKLSRAPSFALAMPLNKDQAGCGHPTMPNERCVFDPATLGLANCVVSLVDIQKGKAFEGALAAKGATVVLDQHGCRYVPHVQLVRTGTQVAVKNSDPVQHNVKSFLNNRATLQFNLMSSSNSLLEPQADTVLSRAGTYLLFCDIHFWMTGYVRAVAHPYHALSAGDGTCALTQVPPGQYRIGCWHEGMAVKLQQSGAEVTGYEFSPDITLPEQVVDVPPGGTVDIVFVLDPA